MLPVTHFDHGESFAGYSANVYCVSQNSLEYALGKESPLIKPRRGTQALEDEHKWLEVEDRNRVLVFVGMIST